MCAIFGVFFIKGEYSRVRKQIVKMIKRLLNRGPDATGIKHYSLDGKTHHFIGHQRLSIVDPFGGDQPFYGQYKNTVSVTNGEIFNHMEVNIAK
jgi:asparagine synthase (glutamine-hydrolysing)